MKFGFDRPRYIRGKEPIVQRKRSDVVPRIEDGEERGEFRLEIMLQLAYVKMYLEAVRASNCGAANVVENWSFSDRTHKVKIGTEHGGIRA
jgi:hypothetical protein